MDGNYYLGLDMGTSSCGWSVTDEEYHVLRRHGKALWGVRLFEGAKTAEERRMHRTGRRRLDRRGWRINILQELFAEEVSKIDPGFFLRMKESKYYPEDKRDINGERPELPYALFVDPEFTDKDYHREFPTIYHLRKWLMGTKEVPDIRLVYLALHHMMKHRGHFLLSGDIEQVKEFKNTFETFIQNVKDEELDFDLEITEEKISYIEEVLSNKNILKSTKKSRLVKELGARTKCEKAVITLLTGGTAKLSDIFANEELDENERPKISFADNGYDEYIESVEAELGEQFYIIASAKAVYDWSVLTDILDGCTSISEAKNTKEAVWTEIVTEKIRKQKELLEIMGKEEAELLSSYLKEIVWNDTTNREGHAAKVYFNALFGLDFTRTEDNNINAALNYGYSIILSTFTREIAANGYITQLGLFHDNMFNQFNLASDLMEPFRVLIDREVKQMKLDSFEHDEKMQLVNVLNQEVSIDGRIQYVNNAIKIYCKSVFDALNDDDSSLVRFYRFEL